MDQGERKGPGIEQHVENVSFNDEIKQAIDQKPFAAKTSQSILLDMSINTGLQINTFSAGNTHLWEISKIIETKSGDSLAAVRIRRYQETITATALYLAQRINNGTVTAGGIFPAMILAADLYTYGNNLATGRKTTSITFDQIPPIEISDRQTKQIDHLLAIDKLFQDPKNNVEDQRVQLLNEFFQSVQTHQRIADSWSQSISSDPLKDKLPGNQIRANQITEALKRAIEYPVEELERIILQQKSKSLLGMSLSSETFNNFLKSKISELESLRQKHTDSEKISKKEKQIAQIIQQTTTMVANQEKAKAKSLVAEYVPKVNYVLATTLGAALMQEAGVDCLIGNTPDASAIFLITSDNKIYFMDMTNPLRIFEITDDMLQTENTTNIALFNQLPRQKGLKIDIKTGKGKTQPFTLYSPDDGQRVSTFFNLAASYRSQATSSDYMETSQKAYHYQKAVEAFEKIIKPDFQDEDILLKYGETLIEYISCAPTIEIEKTSRQKAISTFQQVIRLNPKNDHAYVQLGQNLEKTYQKPKAFAAFQKASEINPKNREAKKGKKRTSIPKTKTAV